ncbi:MAG: CpsD/CapB family tyrosine-protein kinase, partial [Candidatus Omnitrophica bacterium]|nr:CpsD/CapB family tyrosine-protein kinase [Candidatus Omnitrophota bacterium]
LFAIMVGFAVENIDASISTIEDVEKNIGLPVFGTVPYIQGKKAYGFLGLRRSKEREQRSRLISIYDPKACELESIKTLRTHIVQVMRKENKKVMLFSSALQQEGKSSIAANMAVLLANLGMKTLLLDANMRRPTVYKFYGVSREPGLSDILVGKIPWQEAVRNAADLITGELDVDKLLHLQGLDNLRIITCGTRTPNPAELLHHYGMDRLLADLRVAYDAVIIDCPPVLPVTDTLALANKVDGVVVIYRVGKTKRDMLRRTKVQLQSVGAEICGVILNDIKKEEQLGAAAYQYKYHYDEMPAEKSGIINQSLSKLSSIFI